MRMIQIFPTGTQTESRWGRKYNSDILGGSVLLTLEPLAFSTACLAAILQPYSRFYIRVPKIYTLSHTNNEPRNSNLHTTYQFPINNNL